MRYMLDTHILIYLIKNKPPSVATRINALDPGDELCMSFFTYAELLKGAERSTRKSDVLRRLGDLTRSIPVRYWCQYRHVRTLCSAIHPAAHSGHAYWCQ